jgi:hypothetical protein
VQKDIESAQAEFERSEDPRSVVSKTCKSVDRRSEKVALRSEVSEAGKKVDPRSGVGVSH